MGSNDDDSPTINRSSDETSNIIFTISTRRLADHVGKKPVELGAALDDGTWEGLVKPLMESQQKGHRDRCNIFFIYFICYFCRLGIADKYTHGFKRNGSFVLYNSLLKVQYAMLVVLYYLIRQSANRECHRLRAIVDKNRDSFAREGYTITTRDEQPTSCWNPHDGRGYKYIDFERTLKEEP